MPAVSYAVILTRDVERARAAIASIAAQAPEAELLLVLNEPDAAMRAYAHELAAGGARILHDGADLGVVLGWNLALRAARAPYVCVVHEDSELAVGCAARLLETLRERPRAGAVGPRVVEPGGTSFDGAVIWRDGATSKVRDELPCDVHAVDYASSSCLMLRRDAALAARGFDERFFPAIYVDAALAIALWRAGHVVLCDRRAVSRHRGGAMLDPARGARRGERLRSFLIARNRERFRAAFADWLTAQAPRADALDARHPETHEVADARARACARHDRVLAAPPRPATDGLVLPTDLAAHAARLRRELEDEFLAHLVEREAALRAQLEGLHRSYAEQHAELDRVHREYAALWADRERLARSVPGAPGQGARARYP